MSNRCKITRGNGFFFSVLYGNPIGFPVSTYAWSMMYVNLLEQWRIESAKNSFFIIPSTFALFLPLDMFLNQRIDHPFQEESLITNRLLHQVAWLYCTLDEIAELLWNIEKQIFHYNTRILFLFICVKDITLSTFFFPI